MFVEHFKNKDVWMCCCEATKWIYGEKHTSANRDNLIVAIKNLKAGVWDNESLNIQGLKKGGKKRKLYLISYEAFKKLCVQHNEELIDYYMMLESLWFKVIEKTQNKQLEEQKNIITQSLR